MAIALVVGTPKGAAILTSKDRKSWSEEFVLRGWPVTASVADDKGRVYVAVNSPNYGVAIFASDNLKDWKQLESAPRYRPEDRGNPEHHRIVSQMDFEGVLKGGGRFVDQIWTLHFAHGALYAGVSEAGLFVSRDRGQSWQPIGGFNNQPSRDTWAPGFGGLGAHTILSDAKNPNRMWVGVSAAGFFRTDDGGKTWAPKNKGVNPAVDSAPATTGQCIHHAAHDPNNADIMFRQEHRGVHRSDDGGDNWRVIESGLPVAELVRWPSLLIRFPDGDGPAYAQRVRGSAGRRQFPLSARRTARRLSHARRRKLATADHGPSRQFFRRRPARLDVGRPTRSWRGVHGHDLRRALRQQRYGRKLVRGRGRIAAHHQRRGV